MRHWFSFFLASGIYTLWLVMQRCGTFWLSDTHLASVFEKAEAITVRMDQLGYDTLWAAEHRFQRDRRPFKE